VVLNFPGDVDYDPTQPRNFKITRDGRMAADLVIYIDDCRETANSLGGGLAGQQPGSQEALLAGVAGCS
jgi:hypothetical protein